jgi:Flp pilus assembly protein TadD
MRRMIRLLPALLLVTLAVTACSSQPSRRASETAQTERASRPAPGVSTAPEDALKLAFSLRGAGADDQAFAVLEAAHQAYPGHQALLSAYGRQALIMGKDELAARLLRKAVDADASDWRALSALAVLEGRAGRAADARARFMRAHGLSGGSLAVLNNLGVTELLDGNAEEAARLFRKALALPHPPKAHAEQIQRNLAVALAMTGDFAAADRLAGYRLPRRLADADGGEVAHFMGLTRPNPLDRKGWAARLAQVPEPDARVAR